MIHGPASTFRAYRRQLGGYPSGGRLLGEMGRKGSFSCTDPRRRAAPRPKARRLHSVLAVSSSKPLSHLAGRLCQKV